MPFLHFISDWVNTRVDVDSDTCDEFSIEVITNATGGGKGLFVFTATVHDSVHYLMDTIVSDSKLAKLLV